MNDIAISGLYRYPIKGCKAESLQEALLDRYGIIGDRRGMIVDTQGRFLTQREYPQMACIEATLDGGTLRLAEPTQGGMTCSLDLRHRPRVTVTIWKDSVEAVDMGAEPAEFLSQVLGTECRLVWTPEDFDRTLDRRFARDEQTTESVAFNDGFPLLLIGDASLAALNDLLETPVPMERFRPNITIRGSEPYAEDDWQALQIGDIALRLPKLCARCSVTTVDQQTGAKVNEEPLRTLARHRTLTEPVTGKKGAMFGKNAVHYVPEDSSGILKVGDKLTLSPLP